MRCVARFGTICTISKNVKNTHGRVLLLLKVILLHGCFHVFKNVQNVPNHATHHIIRCGITKWLQ